jgi:Arc/MetJ-type ribon-helix-helix transcriptional regulator
MSMSTASGTKSKLRETLKQEDAALAQRSRTVRTAATAAKPEAAVAAAAPAAAPVSAPAPADVIAPVLPPPKPAAARTPPRSAAPRTGGGAAPARTTKVKADAAPGEAAKAAEKPAEKPADRAAEAERKDKHEKVERDSFSMPASEHKRIKALREALGKDGVLASKSEVLRAGLALLAERDIAEVARLVAALPKVAKGKRARKH